MTVAAELAVALHHSRGVGPPVPHEAPRGQTPASSGGRRPGVLKEPEPPVVVDAACPCSGAPLFAIPCLGGGADGVDVTTTRFLLKKALSSGRRRRRRSARRCTRSRGGLLRRLLSKLGSCLKGTRGRRRGSGSFPRAPLLGLFLLALFALRNMDVISTAPIIPGVWYFLGSTGGTAHASVFGCLFWTLFPRAPCAVQAPSGV